MRATRAERHARAAELEAARRTWPDGHRASISFTFDDARRSQVDLGHPVLDQLGIRATFFVLPDGVDQARRGWEDVVAAGHEIGNHTARHPCSGNFSWTRHHAIEDLTLEDMDTEITEADRWIRDTLGTEARVFAYPCGHTFVGRGLSTQSFVPLVADRFVAGRTFNDVAANSPLHCDLAQVMAMSSDGCSFEDLEPALDATLEEGAWLVLGGHEIGHRGDFETTMPATLAAVVDWCRSHDVWIETIATVAGMVRSGQQSAHAARTGLMARRAVRRMRWLAPVAVLLGAVAAIRARALARDQQLFDQRYGTRSG